VPPKTRMKKEPGAADGPAPQALPPFAALRAFEAYGRLGGVRKAAAALSLHHAVVSRHLAALEDWTGTALIDRARRGGALTEAGGRYHARIASAIAELAAATREVTPREEDGRIRVWASGGLAARWLGAQLVAFAAANPALDVELRPSDLAPDLLAGEADIDIRYVIAPPPPGFDGKGLRRAELARPGILAVAGGGLGARLANASPQALLEAPLLRDETDAQWRAWFAAHGVAAPDILPGPRLWQAHLAIAAAIEGKGVALATTLLCGAELADGRLVAVGTAGTAGAPSLGAYVMTMRADRWSSPATARLRSWLQRAAADHA
jgi:LysR family transcriptional regulator, glycine cleavage system transcriptional activator